MLTLPKLPYTTQKYSRQITNFAGLNLTENTADGELRDSIGISTAAFPYLTQRKGRATLPQYVNAKDVFEWDGNLVVVDGTNLYYNGDIIGAVIAGRKRFAVINTKLCIFPDKMYLDLTSNRFHHLDASAASKAGTTTTFTTTAVSMTAELDSASTQFTHSQWQGGWDASLIMAYTGVVWSANDGWTLTGGEEVTCDESEEYPTDIVRHLQVGDLCMLQQNRISGSYVLNTRSFLHLGDEDIYGEYQGNNEYGYYASITGISYTTAEIGGVSVTTETISYQIMHGTETSADLSEKFAKGDHVEILIDGTLAYSPVVSAVTSGSVAFEGASLTAATTDDTVIIRRKIPDLDFICESNNRLWGASNADKTVYCSSLGDPTNFFAYDGLSTDGYAVAIGSEGEFTAICAYSSNVLVWKENHLHKIMGSYPAEYYIKDDGIDGVQAGSDRSLVAINETLFYKGVRGVYAYTGGRPTLISRNLGTEILTGGCAGTDGTRYILSALKEDDAPVLLTYDTACGLWLKEDTIYATAFCLADNVVFFLSGTTIYRYDAESSEVISWLAEFAPFTEDALNRKAYSRLLLRFDLSAGARLIVETREDRGRWNTVYRTTADRALTCNIPVRLGRCDRLTVRLSGVGGCVVRAMAREFSAGSEV